MGVIDEITAYRQAAIAACAAGDYPAAERNAYALLLCMASPNVSRSLGSGSQSITFPGGESIQAFIARMSTLAKATAVQSGGPFRSSKVVYARAGGR